jgi:hypothetical protein
MCLPKGIVRNEGTVREKETHEKRKVVVIPKETGEQEDENF